MNKNKHDLTHYRKQGQSMLITVPKSLRKELDWEDGESLIITVIKNSIIVTPLRQFVPEHHMVEEEL